MSRVYIQGKTPQSVISRQEYRATVQYLNDLRKPPEPSQPISEKTAMLFALLELAYEASREENDPN